MKTLDYEEHLLNDLKDPNYAAGYLTAALDESEDVFLLALCDVAKALGGMTYLSKATKLNRENLYDMLSKKGNPRLSSIIAVMAKLGFEIKFTPRYT